MSFDTAYIFLAIIISTAAIIILIGTSRSIISRISIQPILIHRFCNFVALMTALSPLVYLAAPDHSFTVVSAQTFDSPQQILKSHPKVTHYKNKVMPVSQDTIPYKAIGIIALCLIFLWYFSRYLANARKIYRILNSSIELRSIGKVKVLISGSSDVPFAYRTFRKAYVVVPESLISNLSHLQLAIKHELQHHRQGDTIWSHIAYFIKSLFFWNPLVHLAHSRISEVQELACDEALIGRKGVNTHQYCYCLLTVAENALNSQRRLVGTTGMSMGSSAQQLKWRVEMMSRYDVKNKFKKFVIMGSLTTTIIASVALATSGVVYDRKVTLVEAHELAKSFKESKFPIEVNEAVLGQLNYYVGTPRGREFIKGAIGRRAQYLDMMNRIFARYDAPEELQAIALIESGFRNLPEHLNPVRAAGLWQFIPSTARRYGLKVDKVTDERLDIEKETDAMLRLIINLYDRFGDWRLALFGYNAGGKRVQQGINETGSRDPWVLIESGYENNTNYLAKVMAGVLILKNPSLIN